MITKDEALKRVKDDFYGKKDYVNADYAFDGETHFGPWSGGFDADMVVKLMCTKCAPIACSGNARLVAVVKCRDRYDGFNYRKDMANFLDAFAGDKDLPKLFLVDLGRSAFKKDEYSKQGKEK